MSTIPKIIVVLGPNASGKSALAVELARKFNGEIISADSRQVYRGMNIGTGKVPLKKCIISNNTRNIFIRSCRNVTIKNQAVNCYKGIPHYLLDVASPKRRFTVVQYKKLAEKTIKEVLKHEKIPIICGGTGFYIQALTENLEIPAVKPDLKLRAKLEKIATKNLYEKLQKLDPQRAKNIDKFNKRRLIRALEIIYKTGKPVPPFIRHPEFVSGSSTGFRVKPGMTKEYDVLFLGVKKSPQELKKLIAKRLQKRLKQGMIAEVKKLRRQGLSWQRLDDFGLEYRWIAKFLRKIISREEMISRLQKEIEHYAKRQMTWFKRDKRILWTDNKRQAHVLAKNFMQN